MNPYWTAFGVLGLGWLVAGLLWVAPGLQRRRHVRRFRRELVHLEAVSLAWSASVRQQEPSDEVPDGAPETRRFRRGPRRGDPRGGDPVS